MSLWQKLYAFLGFKKSYNALLFCTFASPFFLFALSQLFQCFTIEGIRVSQTAPGEMYWFQKGHRRVGISIHLAAVLPCALLAVLQFIPAIRQKMTSFHRINGRIVLVLLLVANAGALMIARHTFGGTIDIQTVVGVLVIITTVGGGARVLQYQETPNRSASSLDAPHNVLYGHYPDSTTGHGHLSPHRL